MAVGLKSRKTRQELEQIVIARTRELANANDFLLAEMAERQREREAAEHELSLARHAAEAANRAKSEFLAHVSHEIRTPMNGVLGMLDLALGGELTSRLREYLEWARKSAEALLAVINELLDFSRIEAREMKIESANFDLRALMAEIAAGFELKAQSKVLQLQVEIEESVPGLVCGDALRLRQVLINLVDNAVKFTAQGSVRIAVTACEQTSKRAILHFSVSDTGAGIAAHEREIIFEPFKQGSSAGASMPGTGLGQAICRRLVELMGGEISVTSQPGTGSTFSFALPLQIATEPRPRNETAGEKSRKVSATKHAGHILLAEDDPVSRRFALQVLESDGYEVKAVIRGDQALAAAERENFDLIVMDVQMPAMDGLEAANRIRELDAERSRHTPIVAMTAHARAEDRQRCLAAGMDAYLSKPVRTAELLECVRSLLHQRQANGTANAASSHEDPELLREMSEVFRQTLPAMMAEIQRALREADAERLRKAAHKLRGAAANFGATEVCALAQQLEQAGESSDLKGAESLFPSLTAALEATEAQLTESCPNFAGGIARAT
jgi:signal transduction histidine kinase/CheY-like chemotaxis protein/HPt (histidine-containing phosphotransfer) domain-containing protein